MKKFLIVAALGGLLAACEQPTPVLPVDDNGSEKPFVEPKGVIFKDPVTGKDTFIPKDGEGIFF